MFLGGKFEVQDEGSQLLGFLVAPNAMRWWWTFVPARVANR